MKVFNTAFFLFCITNLIFAQNNSFKGTFLNEKIGLRLSLNGTVGNYTGQFKLQNQSFAVTAQQETANSIIGTYPYFGNEVPIQVMKKQGNYTLITEGVTIPLTFFPAKETPSGTSVLTYAGQDGGQGTWKIISRGQTPVLMLTYNSGEFAEYNLTNGASDGQIQLNGRRYFIQEESSCY